MNANSSFNAMRMVGTSMILTFSRMFFIYVPVALLLMPEFGYQGIFMAGAFANCMIGFLAFLCFQFYTAKPSEVRYNCTDQ